MAPKRAEAAPPHFFKVIVPATLHDKKLMIPTMFVKKFGDEMSDVATLTVPNGRVWKLGLEKAEGVIRFNNGWNEFVKHHSIYAGCFLFFRYEENSKFHVLICDKTGCEIQYPKHDEQAQNLTTSNCKTPGSAHRKKKLNKNDVNVNALSSFAQEPASKKTESDKDKLSALLDAMGIYISTQCNISAKDRERVMSAARSVKSKNHAFLVIILHPNKNRNRLYVPMKFAKKYFSTDVIIRLRDSCEKEYTVEAEWDRTGACNLADGWSQFAKDNKLKKGDIYIFELMGTKDNLLKVSIFQATDAEINNMACDEELECVKIKKEEEMEDEDFAVMTGFKNSKDRKAGSMHLKKKLNLNDVNENAPSSFAEEPASKRTKFDELELLVSLEAMGIYITTQCNCFSSKVKERVIHVARSVQPKSKAFLVVLHPENVLRSRLYVPVKFAGNYLSTKVSVRLSNSCRKQYTVDVTWGTMGCHLTDGWSQFSKDNKLKKGDICIFELMIREDNLLMVSVFKATDDERVENAQQVTDNVKLNKNDVNVNALCSFAQEPASKRTKSDKDKLSALLDAMGIYISTQCNLSAKDRERVMSAARSVKPKNHAFMVIILHPVKNRSRLYVPMKFAKKYFSTDVIIRLRDSSEKEYTVEAEWDRTGACNLADGWSQFAKDNKLKEGDIYMFELMGTKDNLLIVSIFQATDAEVKDCDEEHESVKIEKQKEHEDSVVMTGFKNSEDRKAGSMHLKKKLNLNDANENAPSSFAEEPASKRTKFDEHELLVSLEAMGIYITKQCNCFSSKDKERVTRVARTVKPKSKAIFLVVLRLENLLRNRLYVPMKFARHYFSTKVSIRLSNLCGKQYTVDVTWGTTGCYLTDGWSQFSKDNKLKKGDICIFELMIHEDNLLMVSVFKATDDERVKNAQQVTDNVKASNCKNTGSVHRKKKVTKGDVIVNARSSIAKEPASKRTKSDEDKLLALLDAMGIYISTQCNNLSAKDKERVISAASSVKPRNPAFMVIILYPKKNRSRLYVPMKFAKKYFSTNIIIKLTDSCGKEYNVEVIWTGAAGCNLGDGWSQFSKDNSLKRGDICVFELMSTEDNLLKISVFQASDPEIHDVKIEKEEEMEDVDSVVMTSFGECSAEEKNGLKIDRTQASIDLNIGILRRQRECFLSKGWAETVMIMNLI